MSPPSLITVVAMLFGLAARLVGKRKAKVRLVQRGARLILKLTGAEVLFTSPNTVTEEAVLLVANREGRADPIALAAAVPFPFLFADRAAIADLPKPLRFLLKPAQLAPVYGETSPVGGTLRQRIQHGLEAGHSVLTLSDAPPGTAPGRSPFRLQAFLAAAGSGSAILPVAVRGTAGIFANGHRTSPGFRSEAAKIVMGDRVWLRDEAPLEFAAVRELVRERIRDLSTVRREEEAE